MATKKTTATAHEAKAGYEFITVPRGQTKDDINAFVKLNGKTYILPKGQTVEVPEGVAIEFRRAEAAKDKFFETQNTLIGESKFA